MAQPQTPQVWFSRKEAATYLTENGCRISVSHLANMAADNNVGRGPTYHRVHWHRVVYHRTDLEAWLKRRMVRVE